MRRLVVLALAALMTSGCSLIGGIAPVPSPTGHPPAPSDWVASACQSSEMVRSAWLMQMLDDQKAEEAGAFFRSNAETYLLRWMQLPEWAPGRPFLEMTYSAYAHLDDPTMAPSDAIAAIEARYDELAAATGFHCFWADRR